MYYSWGYKQIKSNKSNDQKNSTAKKNFNNTGANGSSNSDQLSSQSGQAKLDLDRSGIKDFHLCYSATQDQNSTTPTTNINTTTIKKGINIEID